MSLLTHEEIQAIVAKFAPMAAAICTSSYGDQWKTSEITVLLRRVAGEVHDAIVVKKFPPRKEEPAKAPCPRHPPVDWPAHLKKTLGDKDGARPRDYDPDCAQCAYMIGRETAWRDGQRHGEESGRRLGREDAYDRIGGALVTALRKLVEEGS